MSEMGWLTPGTLWHLLWLCPGLCLLAWWSAWRRRRRLAVILGTADGAAVAGKTTLSPGRRRWRLVLWLLAVPLLVAALARPYWGLRIMPFAGTGRDVMIVLDVSRSMLADDLKPSRLEHAKWLLRELIVATPGDRYGIVAFAGDAFLQCPLTADRNSLFLYLHELSPASIPVGGTNLERGLRLALAAFDAAGGGHRAVLLVTDGDELSGDIRAVIEEFSGRRLPLFAVGLGDPAGSGLIPIAADDGTSRTLLRDRHGELVVSRLNETLLREIALATPGGMYLRSTVSDPGGDALKGRIQALVPEEYAGGQRQRPLERFPLALGAAVGLLLIRLAVGERRRLALFAAGLLMMAGGGGMSPVAAQAAVPGEEIHLSPEEEILPPPVPEAGEAEGGDAVSSLRPWQEYNRALKLHEAGRLDEARRHYEQAINAAADRPEVRTRAYRNLGVAAHQAARQVLTEDPDAALRELSTAEEFYREAMRTVSGEPTEIARNQQLLLDDRQRAEKIRELRKQMRERQQQATEQTRTAHEAQQQANQDGQEAPSQAQAEQQTEAAQQAVEQFRQAAEQAAQPQAGQTAEQAAAALRQARSAQQAGDGAAAEQHLAQAMQALGAQRQDDAPSSPPAGGEPDAAGERPPPKQPPPRSGEGGEHGDIPPHDPDGEMPEEIPEEQAGDIDPRQAAALLDLMAEEEKDLRDALREHMRRNARLKPVEKDW